MDWEWGFFSTGSETCDAFKESIPKKYRALRFSFAGFDGGEALAGGELAEFGVELSRINLKLTRPGAFASGLFLWSYPMTQRELERQISKTTGESIHTIRHLGFSPLQPEIPFEERSEPLMVDWDLEFQKRRLQGSV